MILYYHKCDIGLFFTFEKVLPSEEMKKMQKKEKKGNMQEKIGESFEVHVSSELH
jgi:hypothetical protein